MVDMNTERYQGQGSWQGEREYDPEGERSQQARNEWQRGGSRRRYDQESGTRSGAQYGRQPGMGTGNYYGEQFEPSGARGYSGRGETRFDAGGGYAYGESRGGRQGSSGVYGPRGQQSGEYSGSYDEYPGEYGDPAYASDYVIERGYNRPSYGEHSRTRDYREQPGRRGYGQGGMSSGGWERGYDDRRQAGQHGTEGRYTRGGLEGGGAWDWEGGRRDFSERDYGYLSEPERGDRPEWSRTNRADLDRWRPGSYQGSGYGVLGGYDRPRGYGQMSEGGEGPYQGRGPRGYKRSDERICEEVCERLMHLGQVDASDIDVDVRKGEVMLTGMVRDRYQKRMAEDCVESVWGVRDVSNKLKIEGGRGSWRGDDEHRGEKHKDKTSATEEHKTSDVFTTPANGTSKTDENERLAEAGAVNPH